MTTILLIEDSLELAEGVTHQLQQRGYDVIHAADGLTGLECFQLQNPDLVILDWILPRLDGLEVLRRIRQQAATPVLMLTACSDETDRVIGLEVGADDYLCKPFGMRELLARVHALLRRMESLQSIAQTDRSRPAAGTLVCGVLTLEPETYRATLAGVSIDLARSEFELLQMLVRNPGRVFNRVYLEETLWGENFIPGDRSIDNLVLRLRKKLGGFGENIESVWGVGYRLDPPP